jgi:hypothetical protein
MEAILMPPIFSHPLPVLLFDTKPITEQEIDSH